jgi:predicted TIM-barrel fold metal-dependent hydrolase
MLSLLRKFPNIYVDTSAYSAKRYPPELVDYLRGGGRTKTVFGTNYPMITPQQCLEQLDDLDLDEETTRLFLHENAERVFKIDPA